MQDVSSSPSLRPLTRSEIYTLAEEHKQLEQYENAVRYCETYYGPRAHKIIFEIEGESDDEGGMTQYISYIGVKDKDGDDLDFDFTLPYWTRPIKFGEREYNHPATRLKEKQEELDQRKVSELLREELLQEWAKGYLCDEKYEFFDADTIRGEYILGEPPLTLTYPVVYVEEPKEGERS